MSRIDSAWSRIVRWFETHQPEAVAALGHPASDDEIAAAEAAMGVSYPEDLKALYRIANGGTEPTVFDDGHTFIPLSEAVLHCQVMQQFVAEKPVEDFDAWRESIDEHVISVKGPVKPWIFSALWIPLSTSNGDVHRYIDFDPAPGGSAGQVIEHYTENCSHQVLAASLADYLDDYAGRLESGKYRFEHGWLAATDPDDGNWGVPDYLRISTPATPADPPQSGAVEMTGDMGVLAGTGEETHFSLRLDDGRDADFIATRTETRGFNNIRIDQRVRVTVVPARPGHKSFLGTPEYLVLDYRIER